MNTEQIRADFEVFAIPRNYDLDAVMLLSKPPKFSHYVNQATQDAFEAYQAGRAALQSQEREDDPLQPAVNWLIQAIEKCTVTDIQYRLSIGYNRAQRLFDHARRIEGGGK